MSDDPHPRKRIQGATLRDLKAAARRAIDDPGWRDTCCACAMEPGQFEHRVEIQTSWFEAELGVDHRGAFWSLGGPDNCQEAATLDEAVAGLRAGLAEMFKFLRDRVPYVEKIA